MFRTFRQLKKQGVLSINQRNSDFVLKYNPRRHYPLVDNKLKSKYLAMEAGIAVPPLYTVIEHEYQLRHLSQILAPYPDFVIKPAHGTGGDGIIVIKDRVLENKFRQINGKILTCEDLSYHLSSLLSGAYSLGGRSDCALVEHRVVVDPIFETVSFEGIPDIRVVVLLGYPAMAMVRLPTRFSSGRANLHQGAIGVGIDMATGQTLGGVFQHEAIDHHPDTLNAVFGITVPYWDKILNLAARCYELTGLGYLGVDLVLDKIHGPLMLEINARPGLNIQIANREGLLDRYRLIESHAKKEAIPVSERIEFSKRSFDRSVVRAS